MIYMVGFRWMFDIYVSLLEGMEWGTLFSNNPNMKNNEGQRFKQPRHARTDHGSSRLDRATTDVGVDGFGKRRLQRIWNLQGSHHVTPPALRNMSHLRISWRDLPTVQWTCLSLWLPQPTTQPSRIHVTEDLAMSMGPPMEESFTWATTLVANLGRAVELL